MLTAKAELATDNGSKYLVQLFKHFAHKTEVTYTDTHGEGVFAFGTAHLDADAQGLKINVAAADQEQLERGKSVIESHLLRFAFREQIEKLDWH